MTVLAALGVGAVLLTALLIALLHSLGERPQRVPPAHPRATVQDAWEQTGHEVDSTVFPARGE